jgi:hypothetical protein
VADDFDDEPAASTPPPFDIDMQASSARSTPAPPADVSEIAAVQQQPVKVVPKPRPIPRKVKQASIVDHITYALPASTSAAQDTGPAIRAPIDVQEHEQEADPATPRPAHRTLADEISTHDSHAPSHDVRDVTVIDTVAVASGATVVTSDSDAATVPVEDSNASQIDMTAEFASNNTGWFNPDGDDNDDKRIVEDEDDNTGADILMVGGDDDDDELDSEDDMSDVDDPRDDTYTPTQPLTNPLPRRKKSRHVRHGPSTKRARAETGSSSSSSSTHERHKQNKKPRVQPSGDAGDEYDATILPV